MNDISSEADVKRLVDTFYTKVQADSLLDPIFSDFAKVDWSHHLPKMYAFWGGMILGQAGYTGQPWPAHAVLPVSVEHFQRWLALFHATVDENFSGEGALRAKNAAASIANTFAMRMGLLDPTSGRLL